MSDTAKLMDGLKQFLTNCPKGTSSLEVELESAAKHIPAYLKIVKSHIDQLARVLELETHNNRKLDNAGLAEPVTQLIQIFQELDDNYIQVLENLAYNAKNWFITEPSELVPVGASVT